MNPERLRQIAILVDSLDTAQADRLLDQLPEAAQQQVRSAVMDLPKIEEQERQAIIQDFVSQKKNDGVSSPNSATIATSNGTYGDPRAIAGHGYSEKNETLSSSNIPEYQKYLNRKSSTETTSPKQSETESRSAATMPKNSRQREQSTPENDLVDILSQADIETLAAVVMKETPQVLAVVLSMLPADKSARLLELFPDTQRQDALRRLGNLDDIDEQILDHLQQQLDRIVRRRIKLKRNQRSGPQALAAILSAAHRLHANEVVDSIHRQFQSATPSSMQQEPAGQAYPTIVSAENNHQIGRGSTTSTFDKVTESHFAGRPANNQHGPSIDQHQDAIKEDDSIASQLLNRSSTDQSTSSSATDNQPSNTYGSIKSSQKDPDERLASSEVNQIDAFAEAEIRFDFARLAHCDRKSLESLLATAKPKLTLLALRGASPRLLSRVLRLLPATEAKEVEYRIQNLGATRLHDIQQAQQYLLRLASVLEDMGRFRSPRKSLLSF